MSKKTAYLENLTRLEKNMLKCLKVDIADLIQTRYIVN